jgi:hypothetical protein
MVEQCIYLKQDQCNGMLKDADLSNLVSIQSVPYQFDFIGRKKRVDFSNEIKDKAQDCIDKVSFYKNMERENKLLKQLYDGVPKGSLEKGISKNCNEKDCPNCDDCKFSDENRFETAFYITRDQDWDIIDTLVKVSWYEKVRPSRNTEQFTKSFILTDNKKCDFAVFRNGNSKCCYKVEVMNRNMKKVFYVSNWMRFPQKFVNIILSANGKDIKVAYTEPPSGEICKLGDLKDDETMY